MPGILKFILADNDSNTYTLTGLTMGQTYHIAVIAYDQSRMESGFSNEVSGDAKQLNDNLSDPQRG